MKNRWFRRYLRVYGGGLLVGLGIVALFNGVVDPYRLFRWVDAAGFNHVKPFEASHRRLIKAYRIRALRPRGLILGSSRAEHGLSPRHPAWSREAHPCFNASLPDCNAYEMLRYFQHAVAQGRLKQAVLGLDFFSYNIYFPNRPDFDEARLSVDKEGQRTRPPVDESVALLLSWDVLRQAALTLKGQRTGRPFLQPDGQQAPPAGIPASFHGYHGLFLTVEREYMYYKWTPPPARRYALRDPLTNRSTPAYLSQLLKLAAKRGVDVRLFISPSHARLMEGLDAMGLWDKFEEWKRALVQCADDTSGEGAGPGRVQLWDFSGYSSVTTEAIPAFGDMRTQPRFFRDPTHYTREVGDMILSAVLGAPASGAPPDFGVRLNPGNIDEHLAQIRWRREIYRREHPEDVAEISELAHPQKSHKVSEILRVIDEGQAGGK